jgi:tetratricopeptide (TPR) repeat protein
LKPGLPTEPALVGRNGEIKQLQQHFDSALNGKGATVFVFGEAGVGKTRLVNEFLSSAKKTGAEILYGWCLSGAAIPYFPFTEAFNTYLSTTRDDKAKSAMTKQLGITGWLKGTGLAKRPETQGFLSTPEIERDKTFEAAAKTLIQFSTQKPLVLFLDDLQWADHLSLALVHYLSRKCKNSRLLIIGTYRPEETIPAEEKKIHPLEETMFSMSREDLLVRMELKSLKRRDLSELVKSMFHSPPDEEFLEKLYTETEGNPLFAIETLNLLVEEGYLSEKEGQWMLRTPTEKMGIPSKIQEVITRRIIRLGREERKLLELAAVCGQSFSADILSRTLASDVTDVLQTLDEIQKRHRLVCAEDSTFKFTHNKIREVICENLSSELRKVYHLKTASCLEQVLAEKTSDKRLADIAFHYVEGGAPHKAYEYLIRLGEKAVNIYARTQALDYLNQALEATRTAPELATSENLAKIYKLRGRAWLGLDERAKAKNDFDLMLQNAVKISDQSMVAEAHYFLGIAFEAYAGEIDEAMKHLSAAVEVARRTGNKRLEGRSLGAIGSALMWTTNPDTMHEGCMRLEESSEIAQEIGDRDTEVNNLATLGMYYNWRGQFDRAEEYFNKVLALDEQIAGIPSITFDLFCLCMILGGKGEYNDAILAGQRCLQLARDSGLVSYACMALNTLGWIYHDLSNIELAIEYNNQALEVAKMHQKSRASGAVPSAKLNLAMDYLSKSDYEKAERYFEEVVNAYEQHRVAWWRIESKILLGRAEIALAKNSCAEALRLVEDSLVISRKAEAKKYVAKGLKLKAEIFSKMGKTEEAIGLMQEALKIAKELRNPPTLWQACYGLGLLLEKQMDLQGANEQYTEAIALIEKTASKLKDASMKNTLLTARHTKAIQDASTRTKPH